MKSKHALVSALGILIALLASPQMRAAPITWTGEGNPDTGGDWETDEAWSDGTPQAQDEAILPNVTGGVREITVWENSQIAKLSVAQEEEAASNVLNIGATLTISGSSNGDLAPLSITGNATDQVIFNLGAGKVMEIVNTGTGSLNAALKGTLNLEGASVYRMQATGGAGSRIRSGTWFGGPVNASGTGAEIQLVAQSSIESGTFGGPVTVSGEGSSLAIRALNHLGAVKGVGSPMYFSGNDGSGNAVIVEKGALFSISSQNATYEFDHRIKLEAGDEVTSGGELRAGDPTASHSTTAHFNAGMDLEEKARATITGGNVTVTLGGTSTLAAGSELRLQYTGGTGSVAFTQSGTLTMDGAALRFDFAASGNNTNTARGFNNSGTWTLKENASSLFVSSTGRATSAYAIGRYNDNSGTIRVESGSRLEFEGLYNVGTLVLGSATEGTGDARVYLASPNDTFTNTRLANGGVTSSGTAGNAGTIRVLGDAWLGRQTPTTLGPGSYSTLTLDNGTATTTGSLIEVGDAVVATILSLANNDVVVNNFAGNDLRINENATLALRSTYAISGQSTPGSAILTNDGTLLHAGKLQIQGNGLSASGIRIPTRSVTTSATGTYRISGENAVLEALPSYNGGSVAETTFSVQGALSGATAADTLTYLNSTGQAGHDTLTVTIGGGNIAPGNGTGGDGLSSIGRLEFENIAFTLSDTATLSFDIGGTTESGLFDSLYLGGTGAGLALGSGSVLDIRLVNDFEADGQEYLLIETGGLPEGEFATLLLNGEAAGNRYQVDYFANGISITFAAAIPEPSTGCLGIGALALGWMMRRRRHAKI